MDEKYRKDYLFIFYTLHEVFEGLSIHYKFSTIKNMIIYELFMNNKLLIRSLINSWMIHDP